MTAFVGGGLGYRRAHRAALLGAGPGPALLEVMPEHFFAAPADIDALADRYPLVFHSVGLSVGTAVADVAGDDVTRAQLARVRDLARRARPAASISATSARCLAPRRPTRWSRRASVHGTIGWGCRSRWRTSRTRSAGPGTP